jgi:DNA-binding LacI/PurR family transcriptional regulator
MRSPDEILQWLLENGVTAAFIESPSEAAAIEEAARTRGLTIPGTLSLVALGDAVRPDPSARQLTSFRIPREAMGRQAAELLIAILDGRPAERQRLLPCDLVEGETLGAAPKTLRSVLVRPRRNLQPNLSGPESKSPDKRKEPVR